MTPHLTTTHTVTVKAICPVDDTPDVYKVIVETHRVLPVEEILAAVEDATHAPLYQEDLTRRLCLRLQARVITVGTHSGVMTTCEAAW